MGYVDFSKLKGMTFKGVKKSDNDDAIMFIRDNEEVYMMLHRQDCCESVYIEDINGDLSYLVDSEVLMADEHSDSKDTEWGSCTYTFYRLSTEKGYVDIRWYGESNGYYSESVDLLKIESDYENRYIDAYFN